MLEQAPLAPPPLKPVTRLLVSEKTCTRQWFVMGVEDVVVADTCVLSMRPIVELVDRAVGSTFPGMVWSGLFWSLDSLTGAPHIGMIASMVCPCSRENARVESACALTQPADGRALRTTYLIGIFCVSPKASSAPSIVQAEPMYRPWACRHLADGGKPDAAYLAKGKEMPRKVMPERSIENGYYTRMAMWLEAMYHDSGVARTPEEAILKTYDTMTGVEKPRSQGFDVGKSLGSDVDPFLDAGKVRQLDPSNGKDRGARESLQISHRAGGDLRRISAQATSVLNDRSAAQHLADPQQDASLSWRDLPVQQSVANTCCCRSGP